MNSNQLFLVDPPPMERESGLGTRISCSMLRLKVFGRWERQCYDGPK